jgi:hypothetical protein
MIRKIKITFLISVFIGSKFVPTVENNKKKYLLCVGEVLFFYYGWWGCEGRPCLAKETPAVATVKMTGELDEVPVFTYTDKKKQIIFYNR